MLASDSLQSTCAEQSLASKVAAKILLSQEAADQAGDLGSQTPMACHREQSSIPQMLTPDQEAPRRSYPALAAANMLVQNRRKLLQ